ncbi:MAG: ATP-binding protein [Thermodesulfobacteriota bacterium]
MAESDRLYSILVVDDERNIREGTDRILSRQGYQVRQAAQGDEALAELSRRPADVVLLDLKMPGLDGLEVLEVIRQRHPGTLVIIATGFATIETAIEAMKKGAYDLMTKPFRPDQLRLNVNRAVGHIRLREELEKLSAERERGLWAITTEKGRLKTVVDSIVAGILITDLDKGIVLCNPAFTGMFRLSPNGLIGSKLDNWVELAPLTEMMDQVLHAPGGPGGDITQEIIIAGDRMTYLRATVNVVSAETGQILGLVAVVRDITAQKEQEKEKMAFVAMLTHELRSPLGAVDAQFHVVLKGLAGELNPKLQDMLTRMRKRIQNVQAMINDLLDLSRIEARQFVQEKLPVDVRSVILETVELLSGPAAEKELSVQTVLVDNPPLILADPKALKDVTNNLLSNAIRYTPEGGRISLRLDREGDWLVLTVEDTGLGIAREYHDKIFERFFRVKDERARNVVGTGLGLPIVKAIVGDHGGEVTVDSEIGRGSVFRVRLPVFTPLE